jgi:hypothetical protein
MKSIRMNTSKRKPLTAAVVATLIAAAAAGILLLRPGSSGASARQSLAIPTTPAQIRAMTRINPDLAALGMRRLQQALRDHRRPSLTPAERAAGRAWVRRELALHRPSLDQKAPAAKPG